ncbi:hypothetical protein ASE48_07055 [Mycobacterium sp. Root265]|nr:hypothetical protein ASE48_07055 [Mycobacterium sp. Root265]
MLEECRAGDPAVIGAHDPRAGIGGELLGVAVPRRPARGVGIDQHHGVFRGHRRVIGARTDGIEPVHPDQTRLELQFVQVLVLHPADRQIEAAVGDPGGLRVRGHHPGVHPQGGDAGGPLGPVDRAPVHTADSHRIVGRQIHCPPA